MLVHNVKIVHHVYMAKKVVTRFKPKLRPIFLRQWREYRGLTLEQLAESIGATHATLSRIERGKQPYSQAILEALADRLSTDVASLLMRDPADPNAIWSIWDQAKPGERRMIMDIARTIVKTGTR
jgi:transcriptional regulator with XRE-family HTH domain